MAVTVDEIPELPPISNEADFPKEPLVLWIAEDDEDFREALRTSLARDSLNIRLFSEARRSSRFWNEGIASIFSWSI